MNFFFSTTTTKYRPTLAIPKFQNSGKFNTELKLYQAVIIKNRWVVSEPIGCKQDDSFWRLEHSSLNNEAAYFLSNEENISIIEDTNKLINANVFTDTNPDYRANLMIKNSVGGFSSYQAEYPFRMAEKLGTLYSDCGLLTSEAGVSVGVFIRNIYTKPISEERLLWLFSVPKNEILKTYKVKLNATTYIDLTDYKNDLKGCFIFSKNFLGVPIFVIEYKNGGLSFEHTHPPHESLLGNDRFLLVNKLKELALEKVSKADTK